MPRETVLAGETQPIPNAVLQRRIVAAAGFAVLELVVSGAPGGLFVPVVVATPLSGAGYVIAKSVTVPQQAAAFDASWLDTQLAGAPGSRGSTFAATTLTINTEKEIGFAVGPNGVRVPLGTWKAQTGGSFQLMGSTGSWDLAIFFLQP